MFDLVFRCGEFFLICRECPAGSALQASPMAQKGSTKCRRRSSSTSGRLNMPGLNSTECAHPPNDWKKTKRSDSVLKLLQSADPQRNQKRPLLRATTAPWTQTTQGSASAACPGPSRPCIVAQRALSVKGLAPLSTK